MKELREQAMWIIWEEILVVREKSTKGLVGFKNSKEASAAEGLASEGEIREEMGPDGLGIWRQY